MYEENETLRYTFGRYWCRRHDKSVGGGEGCPEFSSDGTRSILSRASEEGCMTALFLPLAGLATYILLTYTGAGTLSPQPLTGAVGVGTLVVMAILRLGIAFAARSRMTQFGRRDCRRTRIEAIRKGLIKDLDGGHDRPPGL
jgi:hypothetical protein